MIFLAGDEMRAQALAAALPIAAPDSLVLFCPGSDALPGEAAPASPANVGQRVAALHRLRATLATRHRPHVALISTGEACARLYPPPDAYAPAPPRVTQAAEIALETLAEALAELGYQADERVDEPGEMALRGQVLDVYPADAGQPYRIEAGSGRITAIRAYDPLSQRTTEPVDQLELGRACDPPVPAEGVGLIAHLPGAALMIEPAAERRRQRLLALAADGARRSNRRALAAMLDEPAWQALRADREVVPLPVPGDPPPRFVEAKAPLRAFKAMVRGARAEGLRLALLGHPRDLRFLRRRLEASLGEAPAEAEGWAQIAAAPPAAFCALPLPAERGFRLDGVLAIAAADLLGSRARRGEAAIGLDALALADPGEMALGDVVVHEDHGVALLDGVVPLPDGAGDAIALRHAGDNRRLVPVAEADRLWRYGGDAEAVTLDTLDGASWRKRRGAIDQAIGETARHLIARAEARAAETAPVLAPDSAEYERFASGFAFSETPDQSRAIEAVRHDLASGRPMDRLVVGDVGFGKTEVALRAAAMAALAGWQVAVAAPTTVLVRQHLETFRTRFAPLGLRVEGLSRLSSPAERRAVRAGLQSGEIRIVVGTGAVAAKGIAYDRPALVIVDEEQRFGAADKERLRQLGAGHVLTLTATPIPRTLQGALVGLRQLSVIATPPARRQPVRTTLAAFTPALARAALLREAARGGQSFVVVPRIADLAPLAAELAKLVPELSLVQAHGKMPAAAIDEAMVGFAAGEGDVLLATNIIEAGLDVPRANTMLIWRADRFGLAQLHQLRGRVGRGGRRGQVLLLTEAEGRVAPATVKRLRTLEALDRLGAGFAISARDLDMRGAGDLIGEEQAGHMKLIGIDLYQHLLAGALRAARGEPVDRWTPELMVETEGCFPEAWVPEADLRVSLYARLARIETAAALDGFEAELEDRFGPPPPEAVALLGLARLRLAARALGIQRIDAGPAAIALTPRPGVTLAAPALSASKGRLLLAEAIADPAARLARVASLLAELEEAEGG
ncbi:DEAD/DEAH box helicase [Sphingomonas morindae]|uniref:Transcription-repair-coupling factor n=2 Tax=Sphingomonas morindae TaxID=1541170 RepID=A0ABY4XCA7_9SPHN|nr:TRCF domain-containing protein [Sphingomonas morindae]USI74605.1 DEAD/DEAH box helicase [Sphingomonas morindae]